MERRAARRVHILGGSGSGTTTLGAALGRSFAVPHLDTDAFFWIPTDPPFLQIRAVEQRTQMLTEALDSAPEWVLSGSLDGWGDFSIPRFTCVVHLTLSADERMARLRRRESTRHGSRIQLGGDMHQEHLKFLAWAEQYDTSRLDMRTQARHERWLRHLPCPVLHLDSDRPVTAMVAEVDKVFSAP
jgi:adenylate kinase family enzyme